MTKRTNPSTRKKPVYKTAAKPSPVSIEDPYKVLQHFFQHYDLPSTRIFLQEWQAHLLLQGNGKTETQLPAQLGKLVEAAWLLLQPGMARVSNP